MNAELCNYQADIGFESNENVKVSKSNNQLKRFFSDNHQTHEDAQKIEQLVSGYAKRPILLKQSSSTNFSDAGEFYRIYISLVKLFVVY
jgi:hypothetical protein